MHVINPALGGASDGVCEAVSIYPAIGELLAAFPSVDEGAHVRGPDPRPVPRRARQVDEHLSVVEAVEISRAEVQNAMYQMAQPQNGAPPMLERYHALSTTSPLHGLEELFGHIIRIGKRARQPGRLFLCAVVHAAVFKPPVRVRDSEIQVAARTLRDESAHAIKRRASERSGP